MQYPAQNQSTPLSLSTLLPCAPSVEQLTLTCLGQCGFLLEHRGVRLVTDPYLSDYVDRQHFTAEVPWKRNYPAPCTLSALAPDAVVISHAHDDHMDPDTLGPYLSSGGQALLAAPAPETALLYQLGCKHIHPARAEQPFKVGHVTVTPIPCAHTELHTDEQGRFRELSYLMDFGGGLVVFFGGDMSLYDGLAQRLQQAGPLLLLLPANGRDEQRTAQGIVGNTTAAEAAGLAAGLDACWIPMHHDLYAVNGCAPREPRQASDAAGARLIAMQAGESLALTV